MGHKGPVQDLFVPSLVDVASDHLEAIILYGSHLLGATPGRHSAYDLVLIVDDYSNFYNVLGSANLIHRPPIVMTIISNFLPPTVIRLAPKGEEEPLAKCLGRTLKNL
jgi:hypothetical protein